MFLKGALMHCVRFLFVFVLSLLIFSGSAWAGVDRPNVLIIYGDDVGFGDVGALGAKLIPTPHIDALAKESLVFTDGHCTAATCTPSRFSMLTGVHGFRHGVRILAPNAPLTIPTNIMTLPKMFQKAGYETGIVGKWHLGLGKRGVKTNWNGVVKPGPLEVGFDYSFLLPSTNDRVPCVYLAGHRVLNLDPKDPLSVGKRPENPKSTVYPDGRKDRGAMTFYASSHGHNNSVINGIGRIGYMWGGKSALWDDETMSDEFVSRAKRFLSKKRDKPFFLFFSSQDIHVPRVPHPRFRGKSKLGYRGDAMVQFDWSTGELLKMLDDLGLKENTIVIFSSDNGPVYDDGYKDGTTVRTSTKEKDRGHDASGVYRGGKYLIYEGGTRVPFMIRWPKRIKAGRSKALVNQIDFLASFARLVGVKLKAGDARDSRDTLDAFVGKDAVGLPFMIEEAAGLALRMGDWKFIQSRGGKGKRKGKLYHLGRDVSEQNNVIKDYPAQAKKMNALLMQFKRGKGVR